MRHPLPVMDIRLVMTLLAEQAAVGRSKRWGALFYLDSFLAVFGNSFVLTGLALAGMLRVAPWWEAQYAVPIFGMVLGNILTEISLSLERFTSDVMACRDWRPSLPWLAPLGGRAHRGGDSGAHWDDPHPE